MKYSNTETDKHIFENFKAGDEKIFELIFNLYYDRILTFCQNFVDDGYIAENICQESFINLWANRSNVSKPNGIRAFLYTSAKCRCLNCIRDRKVHDKFLIKSGRDMENALNEKILNSMNFDLYDFEEMETMLNKAVDELPPKSRTVFISSRFEGKKNSEIAAELNITVKAVEANITRALKKLRIQLSEYLPLLLLQVMLNIFLA